MERQAAGKQVDAQTDTTNSIENPHTKKDHRSTSLPSPPTSVMAADSESDRRRNDSHSGELAGGELSLGGSSAHTRIEANASMKNSTAL